MASKRTILIAAMGTSPAVLTETVWALAHQSEPAVPDEIVALTTKAGKRRIESELLSEKSSEPSVWQRLLNALAKEKIDISNKLLFGDTSIRVFPDASGNGIDDLRTGEDNIRAADFMLRQVRQHTESPDTVVIASIAGGRKTMSAMLFSCMSLLGRTDDKVYHVLLPQPFEGGVEPPFYFPERGITYVSRVDGKKYRGASVKSELFEVPFVRMRGWYQDKFKSMPPTYRTLISKVQTIAPPAVTYPEVTIDAFNGIVELNGEPVKLSRTCFAALLMLAQEVPPRNLHGKLVELHASRSENRCAWLDDFREGSRFATIDDTDDLYKTLSELRKRLVASGFTSAETLVPQRTAPVTFPLSRIKLRNLSKFADVCGCLIPSNQKEDGV